MLVSVPPCCWTLRLVQGLKRLLGFDFRERAIVHQLLDECLKISRVPAPYSSDLKRGWEIMRVIRGAQADVDRLALLVRREVGQSTGWNHKVRVATTSTVLNWD